MSAPMLAPEVGPKPSMEAQLQAPVKGFRETKALRVVVLPTMAFTRIVALPKSCLSMPMTAPEKDTIKGFTTSGEERILLPSLTTAMGVPVVDDVVYSTSG